MWLTSLPIYVITVAQFTERHESIKNQLGLFGLEPTFIWEYDADSLTDTDRERCVPDKLPDKSISTVLKHIEAERKLLESEFDWCLVLEDDALLTADFNNKMESVILLLQELNYRCLVFLGGTDNRLDSRFFNSRSLSLIESPMTTAEAYLLNRKGCEARLKWLDEHKIDKPADHFLTSLDEALGIIHLRVSEPFVSQGSITGRFRTALDSSRGEAWGFIPEITICLE
ncbi:hypothetical protein OA249_02695 [Litorivicinus sp.]|nr:hypothetical protein [Litorivicinus sp.]